MDTNGKTWIPPNQLPRKARGRKSGRARNNFVRSKLQIYNTYYKHRKRDQGYKFRLFRKQVNFPLFFLLLFFFFFFIKAPACTQARTFLCVRKVGHEFFLRHYLSAKAHPCFPIMAYLTHQPPAHSPSLSLLDLRIAHRSPR